ncbi:radical SAM protein [Undibacterium sp. Jales W-56]|uniref:radical SAM protein n=1 Tax=Undibacterium sp. Jales W-56 TaxID=2897325 RepID=UPI0021CF6E82|nr:radical SAM protein [Undibacterium sp. Jales W-56]MCU6434259.1 radical SAM protein [Undibacterium sp. Jales W-56]
MTEIDAHLFQSPTGIAPVLQVHPTRRCNLACLHCYTSSAPSVSEQLDWNLLSTCVQDAALLGYRQLAVSGGEPLLYKQLPELLSQARALGMLTSITTNGMLATPQRWAQISDFLDVVAVSIDGSEAEHDAMRGQPGAYAKTLAHLAVIRASGVPFGLIFTLTQHNVDSLEFVVQLAAQQGARSVQVHPLTLYGRAAETLADARPDGLELLVALAEAKRLGQQLGVTVHVDAISLQQLHTYHRHLVPSLPVTRLPEVAPILIVQADGAVVPLTHDVNHQLWLGSLHDAPLHLLAPAWMQQGRADLLAQACAQTWDELSQHYHAGQPVAIQNAAVYWYDEVAASTRRHLGMPVMRCVQAA